MKPSLITVCSGLAARLLIVLALLLCIFANAGPNDSSPQQRYAEQWAATAVREMYRSGVPASITLAQGILESRSGQSTLASEGNNHFGIKCHTDWKGKSMKMDDDSKGECFRVYDNADESFKDHSDFLRYRDRYKFLFDFDTKDYESWAYGLKKAGYATDPSYASKLIRIIEDYNLAKYDSMSIAEVEALSPAVGEVSNEPENSKESKMSRRQARKAEKKAAKAKKSASEENEVIPESPLSLETAVIFDQKASESFNFSLRREVYATNGVAFVYAIEGETYESIASAFNLFHKEILKINDLSSNEKLVAGTVVYIQQKKAQAEKGLDKYIVEEDGENLRDICQRFAVKLSSIRKLNGFDEKHMLRSGDTILLRK